MSGEKISVIIVAGGSGTRMGADMPKQFLLLGGCPILMRTIDIFRETLCGADIVVALPEDNIGRWEAFCDEYGFVTGHRVVAGGQTRFHSVKNALAEINSDSDIVLVHDGVRPLVTRALIARVVSAVPGCGAVVPLVPLVDSVRMISDDTTVAADRSQYAAVQTPQGFRHDILTAAYGQDYSGSFTDDASVVESFGQKVCSVEGEISNIKITSPLDLMIAEVLLSHGLQVK